MNLDEVNDRHLKINYVPISNEGLDNTTAVLIIKNKDDSKAGLLSKIIDSETVLNIQKQVLDGKIEPSY